MSKRNTIGCRFCSWTTRKFGGKSTPAKAFARLGAHIDSVHPIEAEKLFEAAEASEIDANERIEQYRDILQ